MTAAILGYGESGRAVAAYLDRQKLSYVVYEREAGLSALREACPWLTLRPMGAPILEEVIYRSPGIRPDIPPILEATQRGSRLTSEVEAFCERCPAPIYGVTGSDGKTTTATMAAALLRATGKRVFLGGNIGNALLPDLENIRKEDAVVLELSSFQLMTFHCEVEAGVVTNVTDNHLNWHRDRREYRLAKSRLLALAKHPVRNATLTDFPGRSFSATAENANFYLQNGTLYRGDTPLCREEDIPLKGLHQIENLLAAIALTGVGDREVKSALPSLRPIPHRNQYIGEFAGVLCYDSSIDTTPSRTAVTLKTHTRPLTLIAGGRGKGVPLLPLVEGILSGVDRVVFTGEMGEEMLETLLSHPAYCGIPQAWYIPDFKRAVWEAHRFTPKGGTLLLSPGATSFDCFSSYKARGEAFLNILQDKTKKI